MSVAAYIGLVRSTGDHGDIDNASILPPEWEETWDGWALILNPGEAQSPAVMTVANLLTIGTSAASVQSNIRDLVYATVGGSLPSVVVNDDEEPWLYTSLSPAAKATWDAGPRVNPVSPAEDYALCVAAWVAAVDAGITEALGPVARTGWSTMAYYNYSSLSAMAAGHALCATAGAAYNAHSIELYDDALVRSEWSASSDWANAGLVSRGWREHTWACNVRSARANAGGKQLYALARSSTHRTGKWFHENECTQTQMSAKFNALALTDGVIYWDSTLQSRGGIGAAHRRARSWREQLRHAARRRV